MSADRHMYPLTIYSLNKTVVWDEGGTTQTADLTEGTYWPHNDTSATGYPALYDALISAMNNVSPDTYSITAATPSGSEVQNSGVTVTNDSGNSWFWDFSKFSGFTFPRPYLGYPPTASSPGAAVSQTGPRSILGTWQSWTLFDSGHEATDARDDEQYDIAVSSDKAEEAYQLQYGSPRIIRTFEYRWVPAAHVQRGKATDSTHADNAGLPTGDLNNQWANLHESMKDLDEILVVHDDGDDSDLSVIDHDWEAYKLEGREARSSFRASIETARKQGEFYHLQFQVVQTGGTLRQ